MLYNLGALQDADHERIEVVRTASYVGWKELHLDTKLSTKSETGNYKGEIHTHFL